MKIIIHTYDKMDHILKLYKIKIIKNCPKMLIVVLVLQLFSLLLKTGDLK